MQDFIEQAKRVAGSAVERAAWEAEKVRRANARQHELDLLAKERAALIEQLAGVILDLDRRGQLPEGPLKILAERLRTLDADLARGTADVQSIRNEAFVPGSISISVHKRGDQHQAGNGSNMSAPTSAADMVRCASCGSLSRRGAAFCAQCGARLNS